ncbi:MAG: sulfurtransferase TusA family protein [Clostridiaceae bacterium]
MNKISLDCRYDACPIPLLKAAQELKNIKIGEVVKIEIGHMCAAENIIEWAQKNKVEYRMNEDSETGDIEVYLKKTK